MLVSVFCLGHLVHSALLLSVQAVYLRSDTNCGNVVILILDVLYPCYSFCQLFFIFKYSNVVILRNKVSSLLWYYQKSNVTSLSCMRRRKIFRQSYQRYIFFYLYSLISSNFNRVLFLFMHLLDILGGGTVCLDALHCQQHLLLDLDYHQRNNGFTCNVREQKG